MNKRLDPRPSSPPPPSLESLREPLARGLDRIARDNVERAASLVRSPGSWLAKVPRLLGRVTAATAASLGAERLRAGAVRHPAGPGGKTPPG